MTTFFKAANLWYTLLGNTRIGTDPTQGIDTSLMPDIIIIWAGKRENN